MNFCDHISDPSGQPAFPRCLVILAVCGGFLCTVPASVIANEIVAINSKDDGYRGIWYMNQKSNDEYVYKYSGGLGTYCAKHRPFAIYRKEVDKTFFCYGGTTKESNQQLLHMVSYFDHKTKTVPRPTILLNKETNDAHDNPVISIDEEGFVWIFSTSHGTSRPSYIHRSKRPYSIQEFELVQATRLENGMEVPIANFSYMQAWHQPEVGFLCFLRDITTLPNAQSVSCTVPTGFIGVLGSDWQLSRRGTIRLVVWVGSELVRPSIFTPKKKDLTGGPISTISRLKMRANRG